MFDLAGVVAGAVEGGAKAAGDIATGQIDKQNRIDLARELSAIEEAKQRRAIEAAERMRREGVLWGTQGEGGAAMLDLKAREGAQETGILLDRTEKSGPIVARNAGLLATEQDASRGFELAPGQQRFNPDGTLKAENKRETSAEANARLYSEGLKSAGGGTKKADHFEAAEWFKYRKPEDSLVSVTDDITGKLQKVLSLERVFHDTYSSLRQQGGVAPSDANEAASDFTMALRKKAEARMERARKDDPKSQMTLEQAVNGVQRDLKAAMSAADGGGSGGAGKTVPNPFGGTAPAGALYDDNLSFAGGAGATPSARSTGLLAPSVNLADPDMAKQAAKEVEEMGLGTRMKFSSPQVKAFVDAQRQARQQQEAAAAEAARRPYLDAELRRRRERIGLLNVPAGAN